MLVSCQGEHMENVIEQVEPKITKKQKKRRTLFALPFGYFDQFIAIILARRVVHILWLGYRLGPRPFEPGTGCCILPVMDVASDG